MAWELEGWLEWSGGPFVNGAHTSAADFQLLPWLEREQHVAGGAMLHVVGDAMLQQQSGTRAMLCAGCSRRRANVSRWPTRWQMMRA